MLILGPIPATFGEQLVWICVHIVASDKKYNCSRVYFVTDTYPEIIIKNAERKTSWRRIPRDSNLRLGPKHSNVKEKVSC